MNWISFTFLFLAFLAWEEHEDVFIFFISLSLLCL